MDINEYRIKYQTQKSNAKIRGIDFLLTFQEWCEFWGEDIERRGTGPNDLQMQRKCDTGPYAIGNISKGTPKQNAVTRENMLRKSKSEQAALELQIALDAMMNEDSPPKPDDFDEFWGPNPRMGDSYRNRYKHLKPRWR